MTQAERERTIEDLLARRLEVWLLTTKLIYVLHCSDFEEEREALEEEAKRFYWTVQDLAPRTQAQLEEAWVDDQVDLMRNG